MKPKIITLFDFIEGKSVNISREIAHIKGSNSGCNLVFIGGIHGNEPSGVLALNRVMQQLKPLKPLLHGNVYALAGNLTALARGERFINSDLNRIWQADNVERAKRLDYEPAEIINEVEEQIGIWSYIDDLMSKSSERFIFVDLHTTSAKSIPFITMSDTIMNRSFTRKLPVPVVIGIEEHLDEPLLSYVNELGCVSMAFEGGQHTDPTAVGNHESMIWLSLIQAGIIQKIEVPNYQIIYKNLSQNAKGDHSVYAINFRQNINVDETFKMIPGFENFERIKIGQKLATLDGEDNTAIESGLLFMPLYQDKGSDGYFIIRKIARFWLVVSYIFRKLNLYRILRFLPGVKPFMDTDHIMVVNTNVAKWYSKQILNLMGYRRKKKDGNVTLYIRRKYDFKGP